MKILGIDYGKSKIGLAISEADFAEPFKVIQASSMTEAVLLLMDIIKTEQINKVIVGVSEGAMGVESENFAKILKSKILIPVETFDETLTTYDAQEISLEAGVPRKRRSQMEDAYAATLILRNYLDSALKEKE